MDFLYEHLSEFILGSGGALTAVLTYFLGRRERESNLEKVSKETDSVEIENLKEVIEQLKEQVKWLNEQLTDARQQIDALTDELKQFKNNINK